MKIEVGGLAYLAAVSTNPCPMSNLLWTNLKLVHRHFARNRFYASLNIAGLALSFAACLFIGIYVYNETHFEEFHENAANIYRVTYQVGSGDDVSHWARNPDGLVNELPERIAGIKSLVRFQNHEKQYFKIGNQKYQEEHVYVTDPEALSVFSFESIEGLPETALNEPRSIVLSADLARKYFGSIHVLNESIQIVSTWNTEPKTYRVTGVMKDLPDNTHLPVDAILSFNSPEERTWWAYTYLLLDENTQAAQVQEDINKLLAERNDADQAQINFPLQPIKDIHLTSDLARELVQNGSEQNIYLLVLVALLILIIGTINFTNLSNIMSLYRSKETGIRKHLGAESSQLMLGAIVESVYYSFISMLVAGVLVAALFQSFSAFIGYQPVVPVGELILGSGLLLVLVGILGGLYPAIFTSRIKAIHLIRFKYLQGFNNRFSFKQVMLTMQFGLSVLLLAGTFLMREQFQLMEQQQLQLHAEEILSIPNIPDEVGIQFKSFQTAVSSIAGVKNVSACMEVPSREIRDVGPFQIPAIHATQEEALNMDVQVVDYQYFDLMKMEWLAGEAMTDKGYWSVPTFTENYSHINYLSDMPRQYVINETAMKLLGFETPQEALLYRGKYAIGDMHLAEGQITGVVKDFHQETFRNQIDPTVYLFEPIWMRTFLVRLETGAIDQTIAQVQQEWDALFPNYPMTYRFVDDLYDQLYQGERKQLQLLYVFSGLAIFIALIGLLGIVAFTLQMRLKELAIRKVLGAHLLHLVKLLSTQYLVLLVIGMVLVIPACYYLAEIWLANFAYHVEMSWWSFAMIFMGIASLLLLVVTTQTSRAARTNPTEVLRNE